MSNVKNGDEFRVEIDSDVITLEQGFTFDYSAEEQKVATKDGGFVLGGSQTSTISINAAFDPETTTNQFFEILSKVKNGTTVNWQIGGTQAGDKYQASTGKFTQVSMDSQTGQAVTWSATLSVDTANMTEGTVS